MCYSVKMEVFRLPRLATLFHVLLTCQENQKIILVKIIRKIEVRKRGLHDRCWQVIGVVSDGLERNV